ncbi:3-hydroxyacyl-CoA dehydrogenase family protein [Streptomyces sp. NPDC001985]|uniref:3-hydroxyacyl-CoA dehydrogenase family protein n=1 Tax=Streptomyces sp. NPDC001985 TaxID=3154406 RepID=UPI00332CB749
MRVAVIGAGTMGTGVAQNLATAHHDVLLIDTDPTILDHARQQIHHNLRLHHLLTPTTPHTTTIPTGPGTGIDTPPPTPHPTPPPDHDPDRALTRITCTTDHTQLTTTEFVIENTTEQWETKQHLYPLLDTHCPDHCIIAANTSTHPITKIAALTHRPTHIIGIHFMNPAPLKPLVELIPGHHTTPDTITRTQQLLTTLGKHTLTIKDTPGFISNRILMTTINEAINLVHENIATPEQIDTLFTTTLGHTMGPLHTADLIGLDTILHSLQNLHHHTNNPKYTPSPLLHHMVNAHLHGRKTHQGFYPYP